MRLRAQTARWGLGGAVAFPIVALMAGQAWACVPQPESTTTSVAMGTEVTASGTTGAHYSDPEFSWRFEVAAEMRYGTSNTSTIDGTSNTIMLGEVSTRLPLF